MHRGSETSQEAIRSVQSGSLGGRDVADDGWRMVTRTARFLRGAHAEGIAIGSIVRRAWKMPMRLTY